MKRKLYCVEKTVDTLSNRIFYREIFSTFTEPRVIVEPCSQEYDIVRPHLSQ